MIGQSTQRIEAPDKVTGAAKYNNDFSEPGLLHAWMVTSLYAHAKIKAIDTSEALKSSGVKAVVTGDDSDAMIGLLLADRPVLAKGKARYFGEPIAVVVANSEVEAKKAADLVKIEYEPLPLVNSPSDSLKPGAPLVHEYLDGYKHIKPDIWPEPGTNIAHRQKIRKGDMQKGWAESEVVVEGEFFLPQSDHAAMETRSSRAEIQQNGYVVIHSASQAPYMIKKIISRIFHIEIGKVIVHTPLVGGAFGGKTTVQLEPIAFLASKAAGGRAVKLANTREQDMASSAVHIGLEAKVKLGAKRDGTLTAVEMTYLVDGGAYTDSAPIMCKAIAANCTGPYHVDNVWCDVLDVYTNHTYATAFRGFGHISQTFVMERMMEKLAFALGMDSLELRSKNAVRPGDSSPSRVKTTTDNLGNLPQCITRLKEMINWGAGNRIQTNNGKIRAKGISCFWKTSSSPPDAISGAILTLNPDGTVNLNCGVVECGQGTKTGLAMILAEKLKMDVTQIHVLMDVNTQVSPEHWKTVASMSTYMAGHAVTEAADDVIRQIKSIGAIALRCTPEDLDVGGGRVYQKAEPENYLEIKQLSHGFKYPNGNSIGGQIMGRGSFIMRQLRPLDQNTGEGKPGPYWTVGAQAVEVEYDPKDHAYQILRAVTVVDAGKVINIMAAKGQIMGAMCMGLGYGSREEFQYSEAGMLQNPQFRTYKPMRYGEIQQYTVDFLETPNIDAPFGERGLGEHGILGMPSALANALSSAAQADLNKLPLTPEIIWKTKRGEADDPFRV